jgi:hypothetical protein
MFNAADNFDSPSYIIKPLMAILMFDLLDRVQIQCIMKKSLWLFLLPFSALALQTFDMHQIRDLYLLAPGGKKSAVQLNKLMIQVDTATADPLLVCYKGANEMLQAKYTANPIVKFEKFVKGKELIKKAFVRDTLNLEMRFIRFTIQSNLPAFLSYRNELNKDKQFLMDNTRYSRDPELKGIILRYLASLPMVKPADQKLK